MISQSELVNATCMQYITRVKASFFLNQHQQMHLAQNHLTCFLNKAGKFSPWKQSITFPMTTVILAPSKKLLKLSPVTKTSFVHLDLSLRN